MAKYLVEVAHSSDKIDCLRSIQIFLRSGSHFLVNADWGCLDGVHKAWFICDVNNKEEALHIVPPFYWKDATVTLLYKWNLKEVDTLLEKHVT